MAKDARLNIFKKWYKRGEESGDPFDAFIYLWTAMTIAVQIQRTEKNIHAKEDDSDREKIWDYLIMNRGKIYKVLHEHKKELVALTKRKGARYGDPIIDSGDPDVRNRCRELVYYFYEGQGAISHRRLAEDMSELLGKVHNNLFYGLKKYDEREYKELLKLINPVFLAILHACELT